MNYWMKTEKNEELFFRFDGEEVRAIFTPRYRPVDNFEVLEKLDSLGYGPDTQVQCHLDDLFLLVSILNGTPRPSQSTETGLLLEYRFPTLKSDLLPCP